MRTLILRTAALTSVFAAVALNAAEPVTAKATGNSPIMERELQRQIDKYVTYPLMTRNGNIDGSVVVSFVIDTEGQVKVIGAEGTNEELRDHVLSKLAKVDVGSNPEGLWKTTYIRFNFRPEA